MPDKLLYIRVQGKVQGPFCLDALRSMRDGGQFRRFHEISEDCQSWAPATSLHEIFPSEAPSKLIIEPKASEIAAQTASSETAGTQKSKPSGRGEWYYVDEAGKQRGPISKGKLQELLRRGELDHTSHVWNPGAMRTWQAVQSLPEFESCLAPGSSQADRLAFLSLILGVLWLGGLGSLAAMVLGYHAFQQIRHHKGRKQQRRLALAGIVSGAATLIAVTPLAGYFLYHYFTTLAHVQRLSGSATPEEITATFKPRVYFIQAGVNTGSGVMIACNYGRGLIVTNRHILIPGFDTGKANRAGRPLILQEVKTKTQDELTLKPCHVAAYHQRLDIALLIRESAPQSAASIAVVRQRGLQQGEAAVALGSPLGLQYSASPGVIASPRGEYGSIWTTCPINKGGCGGPLFVTRKGLLAGITTLDMKPGGGQNLAGCVAAEEIVDSLQRRLTDAWEWRHEYKDVTLQLADLIPFEE